MRGALRRDKHMDFQSRRIGLKWKIGGCFTAVLLISGGCVIAAVYQVTGNVLRDQLEQHAVVVATNLSDGAAGQIVGNNLLALSSLATKYTLINGVAYAFVEDTNGEVIAHTLGSFPDELRQELPPAARRQTGHRQLSFGGRAVYEAHVPVLDGRAGSVHVGFWQDNMEQQIRRSLSPLTAIVAGIALFGALLSFLLAHWIVRPIAGLLDVAGKVTMGDLETSVSGKCVTSGDEIGELACCLERMRSSLKAAMLRLGREQI
jgi:sensor histidine kinase regulating citrate/malate metabolism